MARPVAYPPSIEPPVQFVEETAPADIVARTNAKLAAGTPVKDMLLASALAVVRSSDLPPGDHGGPLHPLAGIHAVRNISARLPGEYARLPVIQNVVDDLIEKHRLLERDMRFATGEDETAAIAVDTPAARWRS